MTAAGVTSVAMAATCVVPYDASSDSSVSLCMHAPPPPPPSPSPPPPPLITDDARGYEAILPALAFALGIVAVFFYLAVYLRKRFRKTSHMFRIEGRVFNGLSGMPVYGIPVVCTNKSLLIGEYEFSHTEMNQVVPAPWPGEFGYDGAAGTAVPNGRGGGSVVEGANFGELWAVTDMKGCYYFELNQGDYEVTVPNSDKYGPSEDTKTYNFYPEKDDHGPQVIKKKLSAADRPVHMDFNVIPAPRSVSGAVMDQETMAPVAGVKVKLTRAVKPGEPVIKSSTAAVKDECVTDAEGLYFMEGILHGDYTLFAAGNNTYDPHRWASAR
jgi:hypothetical protein